MPFNFRLVKSEIDDSISIYEIYYEEGVIINRAEMPVLVGNDLEDLHKEFKNVKEAFEKPMLIANKKGVLRESE